MHGPMTTIRRTSTKLWLLVTLMILAGCLMSCASPAPKVVTIPADRKLTLLPDGNYQVTPAWLRDRYEYERAMKDQLEKYRNAR